VSRSRQVLYLDPYHTESHRTLAESLRDRSRHGVRLLTLPPRKWKWRMRGSALAFEPQVRSLPPPRPEVLVTTDFLNVPEFLALTRDLWPRGLPVITYFHENQLTYPASSSDIRDFHFGLVNLYTALASDRVLFNSRHHRDEFLEGAEALVRLMPDFRPDRLADRILERSELLGLPLDLEEMDRARRDEKRPWVLWNHRWEEDRNPEAFFRAMYDLDRLANEGRAPGFRLVVAGQTYRNRPAVFDEARDRLGHRIEHWGYVESRAAYLDLVARCTAVISTSLHEFFGVSVLEAIYLGCTPILPRRLTYPEIVGKDSDLLYDDPSEIPERAARILAGPPHPGLARLRDRVRRHEKGGVLARWDAIIDAV
jgi:glycosyltransferase involved in cell wall biosynthesis